MAVREFTDERGERWRGWDVIPTDIYPATKGEDYLADVYQTGWVVFETVSGGQKRRLSPFPSDWAQASESELRAMLARAEPVPARRLDAERLIPPAPGPRRTPAAPAPEIPPAEQRPDITDLVVVRTFRYPGGRYWSVGVVVHPEEGGRPVLRFTSGTRNLDLRSWPRDWLDYPDERLVELLRYGAPRLDTEPPAPDTPRRRWTDHPEPSA